MGLAEELRAIIVDAIRPVIREELKLIVTPSPQAAPSSEGALLSVAAAAEHLDVAERTIRDWIKSGRLAACRPGRSWRIRREDLAAVLKHELAQGRRSPDLEDQAAKIVDLERQRRERRQSRG